MDSWEASVACAQRGDLSAFDAVVRRFQDMAVGYAYSVLGDFHLAEDAAQEAFIKAFRDLGSLEEPRAFPAWLRRIVFKFCDRITRRKHFRTVALDAAAELPDRHADPLRDVQQRQERETVLAAVNALPDCERATTTLFYINGYSMAEVGDFLEVPVGTVKRRLHSARGHLRERMVALVEETLKQSAPGGELADRVRQDLEGVPLVSFNLHNRLAGWSPQTTCFSSCLRSVMEYAGDSVDGRELPVGDPGWHATYQYLMSASGEAYRAFFPVEGCGPVDGVLCLADDPTAGIRRAFDAAGYACEVLLKRRGDTDEAVYRARILESIGRYHRPVLGFGVVGAPECCLITGFDEGGDVLIGWSFFQEEERGKPGLEFEKSGYFRKRGWFADTEGIVAIGERKPRPPRREMLRDALLWALTVQRTVRVGDHYCGLRAIDAWAEALQSGVVPPECFGETNSMYGCMLAEGRCWGKDFIGTCLGEVDDLPGEELWQAVECFAVIHDLVWCLWRTTDHMGKGSTKPQRVQDPAVRREMVRLVRLMRVQDAEAGQHIERALLRMGVEPAAVPPLPAEVAVSPPVPEPERPASRFRSDLQGSFAWPHGFTLEEAPGPEGFDAWAREGGWRTREVEVPRIGRTGAMERLNTDVVLSLRAGLPMLAEYDGVPGVVYGFQVWNREWLLRHPSQDGDAPLRVSYTDRKLGRRYAFLEPAE